MDRPKFYLTTPIYYANARPHIGSAYTTIVCDVIARYKRMCGYDVAFVTGTDEHGEKIARAAADAGMQPGEFVTREREHFKSLWRTLNISDYRFVQTSQNPDHVKSVQWMIQQAQKAGYIEKKKYEGRYCVFDERYVSDSAEPVNCDICGRPAELVSEENYFFKLSAFGPTKQGGDDGPLMKLYKRHLSDSPQTPFVQPDFRLNEVVSFVKGGLRDISISRRRLKWGIPWPGDPEQVVYVWYDALTSYLTAIGFRGAEHSPDFEKFWMGKEGPTEAVHLIGKDILRFHAVYWPAFLMAAGLPLPKTIFAHGWIYYEKDKMSKSKGNVVYPEPIVNVFEELTGAKVGNDALRYYLLREVVFGQDGNFSRDALITRYNADLANGLGNLASRVLTMIDRYCDGEIPDHRGQFAITTKQIAELISGEDVVKAGVRGYFNAFNFSQGIEALWALLSNVDAVLTTEKPWALAEDRSNESRVGQILYSAAEALRHALVLAHPLIPEGTQRIWEQLRQPGKLADVRIDQLKWGGLKPGTKIGKPEAVFPRADKNEVLERIEAMEDQIRNPSGAAPAKSGGSLATSHSPLAADTSDAAAPATDNKITIEDFAKVELRVGVVKSAERIQGADRLLKLLVDIGDETRQILAGIALAYAAEDLIGRKVVIVANLAPRKMRGLESNGMLLAASAGSDGKPVLCTFSEDIPPGAKVK